MLNLATKVAWGLEMLQHPPPVLRQHRGPCEGVSDPASLASWTAEAFDPSLDWDRIKRIPQMVGRAGDPEGHPR
jgi:L-lactate dehydrogenase (cytochrome)